MFNPIKSLARYAINLLPFRVHATEHKISVMLGRDAGEFATTFAVGDRGHDGLWECPATMVQVGPFFAFMCTAAEQRRKNDADIAKWLREKERATRSAQPS